MWLRSARRSWINLQINKNFKKIDGIKEFNIGHFLVGESIFLGLPKVI